MPMPTENLPNLEKLTISVPEKDVMIFGFIECIVAHEGKCIY